MDCKRECPPESGEYCQRESMFMIIFPFLRNSRLGFQSFIEQAYLYLVNQDRSAWTWEIDRELPSLAVLLRSHARLPLTSVRPAHEKW